MGEEFEDRMDEMNKGIHECMTKRKKIIFISGALNSDSVGFLNNVRNMLQFAGEVESLGFLVYVPCNDILMSLVYGTLSHNNYLQRDLGWLAICDALALVPGSGDSRGVKGELNFAKNNNIPILKGIEEVKKYLEG